MSADRPGRTGKGAQSALEQMRRDEPPTVLVVDDQPAVRYAAARMLQHAGFRTLEADNGEDALRLAAGASAVLLDVNLPDINGVEVCRRIKAEAGGARIPIVLMSAVYRDDLHRDAGLSSGADGYLTAPIEPSQLAATFARLLA